MTKEEQQALIGKKKIVVGNSTLPYTVKEVWEHNGFTLCSFAENPVICNVEILKDPQ